MAVTPFTPQPNSPQMPPMPRAPMPAQPPAPKEPDKPDNRPSGDSDADILAEALERYEYAESVDGHNRRAQLEDTRFVYEDGAQWTPDSVAKREKWKLPCFQFNQLGQFVHQVVNDMRQGRPGVTVSPASGDASEKVAELSQDLIRGIEYKSDAESAYDSGFQHAVVGGRGYWRILGDYESPKSFNRCLKIARIADPQRVRIDPDYEAADASDIAWAFIESAKKRADYEREYKDDPVSWAPLESTAPWYSDDRQTVVVADYYRLVRSKRELVLLADGSVKWADEYDKMPKKGRPKVIERREGEHTQCEWYVLAGGEKIVKRHEWTGPYIPVIACLGDEIMIKGKRHLQGLIRHAKGPQVLLNAGMTEQVVTYALTAKAPYIAAKAAIEGYEKLYDTANNENYGVLPFNHKDDEGDAVPMPQRQHATMPDAGWINWTTQMLQHIRSTIGMYENSLGMKGQEVSGRAIIAREKQGDAATFHYLDNLRRAIAHTGRVLMSLIPTFYDTERMALLIGHDGKQSMKPVNERVMQEDGQGVLDYVANPDNDLTRGQYAVAVESGPAYATKREETRATMVELMQAAPNIAPLLMDKVVRLIDMPEADAIADRLETLLPPEVRQMEAQKKQGGEPPDPQVAQLEAQLQQVTQQAQEAVGILQQENAQLKQGEQAKVQAAQLLSQAKMQEAQLQAQTETQKAQMQAKTESDTAQMQVRLKAAEAQAQAESEIERAQLAAQTSIQTKLIEVASKMVLQTMQPAQAQPGPDGEPAAAADPAPAPDLMTMVQMVQQVAQQLAQGVEAPVAGSNARRLDEANATRMQSMLGQLAQLISAPRQLDVQHDAEGNVVGGTSRPVLQ